MKTFVARMTALALLIGVALALAPASQAQAATGKAQKFQALAKQLNLTPQQYERSQQIRQQEMQQPMEKKMGE